MNQQEFINAVNTGDMKTITEEWTELLKSTGDEDYEKCHERNIDLSIMSAVIDFDSQVIDRVKMATIIKETLACAYLLGRRDEKMSTFIDAMNEENP